jgi:hypothetical protein
VPEQRKKPAPPAQPGAAHTKERAAFWCVSLRTMQNWKKARPPVPVDDVDGMIRWYSSQPSTSQHKLTPEFLRRLTELRIDRERTLGAPVATDPDYAAFERDYDASHAKDTDSLARLKRLRDFALFKLERAQARNDLAAVNDASNLLKHNSSIIHDEELRAQKLNREIGDTLPRAQAEQIARAMAYWCLRSIDNLLAEVCPRIAASSASGPLFPEEIRKQLEPALLSSRLLSPMVRSSQIASGMSLPRWWVDAAQSGLAATVENGAAEFAALYATPVPPPPVPSLPPLPAVS